MKLSDDDFTLFGLVPRFVLDRAELDARWRALQAKVHPDRFTAQGASAQRAAMQWALRVNEAYQRLKNPLARAAYLCELRGAAIQAESNTAMPKAFLTQQMAWREALDDAADAPAVEALEAEIVGRQQTLFDELRVALDERGDTIVAVGKVRALMFVERFLGDIHKRLEALDA